MTGIAEVALVNYPIARPIQGTNYVNQLRERVVNYTCSNNAKYLFYTFSLHKLKVAVIIKLFHHQEIIFF